jgi:murein tripeptide amidase MpaA
VAVSYLNVDEVSSALQGLATAYPGLTDLIELPYRSVERRISYALRIGKQSHADAVLFTGCAHAREWGGADACVYFAADLLEAYGAGTGLQYGGRWFSPRAIASIVERVNVVVFPCVNPDGRAYDQQYDALWRKNRNPVDSDGLADRIGVDINRNHSFLWDFQHAFSPAAQNAGTLASDKPVSDLYHGSTPNSEPETRNVHWLLDSLRFARWYLDIHSYDGDVLFSWGDDLNQSTNPSMNFLNPAYDGQRGVAGGYGEYIDSADLTTAQGTAQRVVDAINAVRGGHYVATQSVSLWGAPGSVTYPVSGAVDDYAFSRHRTDCTKPKVFSFTMEFGYAGAGARLSFHPLWPEMSEIVKEIDAAMVELCLVAAPRWFLPWTAAWRRLFPWQIWDPMIRRLGGVIRELGGLLRGVARVGGGR